jgi:hypothetical protein
VQQVLVYCTLLAYSTDIVLSAALQRVTHVGSDGSKFDQRILATGWNTYPLGENVAGEVVGW